MDSIAFYREIILGDGGLGNLYDRDRSDALLTRVLLWVGKYVRPEDVYSHQRLAAWALASGYTTTIDTQRVAALLRRIEPLIVHPSEIATAINDEIHALG